MLNRLLSLIICTYFVSACSMFNVEVPRYNTVMGDKRAPMLNPKSMAPAQPERQVRSQNYMESQTRRLTAHNTQQIRPMPAALQQQPLAQQPASMDYPALQPSMQAQFNNTPSDMVNLQAEIAALEAELAGSRQMAAAMPAIEPVMPVNQVPSQNMRAVPAQPAIQMSAPQPVRPVPPAQHYMNNGEHAHGKFHTQQVTQQPVVAYQPPRQVPAMNMPPAQPLTPQAQMMAAPAPQSMMQPAAAPVPAPVPMAQPAPVPQQPAFRLPPPPKMMGDATAIAPPAPVAAPAQPRFAQPAPTAPQMAMQRQVPSQQPAAQPRVMTQPIQPLPTPAAVPLIDPAVAASMPDAAPVVPVTSSAPVSVPAAPPVYEVRPAVPTGLIPPSMMDEFRVGYLPESRYRR